MNIKSMTKYSPDELLNIAPKEFRSIVRRGEFTEPNPEVCSGYAMANLVIVPKKHAFDFLVFCVRNPRPCPVLEVCEAGITEPHYLAPGADLRTDLPRYSVYKEGELISTPTDILKYWRKDLVSFLLGCSGTFDWILKASNINYRLIGIYTTNLDCVASGPFYGPMVVTCRLVKGMHNLVRSIQISSRHLMMHGPPVHIGNPRDIGINNLYEPKFFFEEPIAPIEKDETPVFWGCGATPQVVAVAAKLPFLITHNPAHMFITDRRAEELAVI